MNAYRIARSYVAAERFRCHHFTAGTGENLVYYDLVCADMAFS
jgi:hypothetical protein